MPVIVFYRLLGSIRGFWRLPVLLAGFLTCFFAGIAQNTQKDSLLKELSNATAEDSVTIYNALCWSLKYSDPTLARTYGQRALAMADSLGDTQGLADALRRLGVLDYVQGRYPAALSSFFQALTLYDKIKDEKGQAAVHNNIGLIYQEQRNYDKALSQFQLSLQVRTRQNDREGMGICNNNIGEVYLRQKDYAQARQAFETSIGLLEAIGYTEDIGRPLTNLGEVFAAENQDAVALQYFFKALRASEKVGNMRTGCRTLHRISKLYQKLGRFAESDIYGERALQQARKLGIREIVRDASLTLSQNYAAANPSRALAMQQLYVITKDSLLSEENNLKLAELESQMDLSKKQTEIDILNKDRELQDTVAKSLIAVAALLLLLAGALGLFYWNKRRDAKVLSRQKNEIEEANKRLSNTIEELNQTQGQLILSEKMASLGRLVANISHEINTPLGAIRASVGTLSATQDWVQTTLPAFMRSLTMDEQRAFDRLVAEGADTDLANLSTRDERRIRHELETQLEQLHLSNPKFTSNLLLRCGITDALAVAPVLRLEKAAVMLEQAVVLKQFSTHLDNIAGSVEKTRRVVFGLKAYTATGLLAHKPLKLSQTLDAALAHYAVAFRQGIRLKLEYQDDVWVDGNAEELEQVWANIIYNAIQAMQGKGNLYIAVHHQHSEAVVTLSNNGPAILPEHLDRIFEPFFTTKNPGEGSGLGLYSCKRVLELHKGSIDVQSNANRTDFTIRLPLVPAP